MRAQLLHLSGPRRGQTETHTPPRVMVGAAPEAEAWLPARGVADRHAEIRWHEPSCSFHLRRLDGRVFVNHQEVEEVILQENDLVEFGVGGPQARFRIYAPPGRACKPVRRMLRDAADVRRRSGRLAGTRTLMRDLLTQATPQLKIGVPLAVLAVGLALAYAAGWLGARRVERQRTTADAVREAEISDLRLEMQQQRAALARMTAASGVLSRIQREYAAGVCLIHGVVGLREPGGAWFRDPGGDFWEVEYTGTGFVAGPEGRCLTNRHVAAPWTAMDELQPLVARGLQPAFRRLTATFPGRAPIAVDPATVVLRTDDIDVAAFRVDAADLPVLPLHGDDVADLEDRRAIVVGYPTGLGALLAKADDALVGDLRRRRASIAEVIDALAGTGAIEPLLTEGVLGNVQPTKLIYDAPTTQGGSGGPVFGSDGTVIGVNYAILPTFGGANFGVPIRFGRELLKP